jgi:hypothetical protein
MAIALEEYATEEQRSVVRFLWAKGLNAKDIHKEMLPVYGGKCLSRKAVHNWIEKSSLRTLEKSQMMPDQMLRVSTRW